MADEYTPKTLRGALSNALCNASNFPPKAMPYVLGKDMTLLLDATVDAILHWLAGHDREVLEPLRLQVEQLQGQLPPCDGGCDYNSGPEETCSAHGRPVAEVWEIAQQFARERDDARAALANARADAIAEAANRLVHHLPPVEQLHGMAARLREGGE